MWPVSQPITSFGGKQLFHFHVLLVRRNVFVFVFFLWSRRSFYFLIQTSSSFFQDVATLTTNVSLDSVSLDIPVLVSGQSLFPPPSKIVPCRDGQMSLCCLLYYYYYYMEFRIYFIFIIIINRLSFSVKWRDLNNYLLLIFVCLLSLKCCLFYFLLHVCGVCSSESVDTCLLLCQ